MFEFLVIKPKEEEKKITTFIKDTLKEQRLKKTIITASGGIDSTTVLYLLKKAVDLDNILVAHLPYFSLGEKMKSFFLNLGIFKSNIFIIPIKKIADQFQIKLKIKNESYFNQVRLGNIMARIRMTIVYDLAKKYKALVCGTENKSEYYLGYFTRFGDEASDIEPIRHLYKTQVYQLANYLGVPKNIINQPPTAGLWLGQTDEKELGFSYNEADLILYLYFDKKLSLTEIKKRGFSNADKVITYALKNRFKHDTPYHLIK